MSVFLGMRPVGRGDLVQPAKLPGDFAPVVKPYSGRSRRTADGLCERIYELAQQEAGNAEDASGRAPVRCFNPAFAASGAKGTKEVVPATQTLRLEVMILPQRGIVEDD